MLNDLRHLNHLNHLWDRFKVQRLPFGHIILEAGEKVPLLRKVIITLVAVAT